MGSRVGLRGWTGGAGGSSASFVGAISPASSSWSLSSEGTGGSRFDCSLADKLRSFPSIEPLLGSGIELGPRGG